MMNKFIRLSIVSCMLLLFSVACVSAGDNSTDGDVLKSGETPDITINSSTVYSGESIDIYLKDAYNTPMDNQNLTANIDDKNYSLTTDSQGRSSLKLDLKPKVYLLNVIFNGSGNYNPVNQTFDIAVIKWKSSISVADNTVLNGKYFNVYLKGQNGEALSDSTVTFTVGGKTYKDDTNSRGKAGFKVNLDSKTYTLKILFSGNDYYKSVSKTIKLIVPTSTSIVIGNTRLLSNGYLRIYLKSPSVSAVSKKTVKIKVNGKTFKKKTNKEGIIVFKPKAGSGTIKVKVKFKGTSAIAASKASKKVKGIIGNVKNPLKEKIPLKKGVPDVDLMPGNYVLADGSMTYTLKKAQYRDVIKRDSYCLFLNNKLSKYTFFKSKAQPKLNHIVKREKWNVIEREINTKIVKANTKGYWPGKVTVSLKGKSYTYPEVRDLQNTGYTCGPTSSSMCSQVLRNYVNEWHLAKQAGTDPYHGSSTKGLKNALEKNHFKCRFYYKGSFGSALKEVKKGGCALVFHTWNHFVCILDISKDGKKVLVGNPSGDYDSGSHGIPTNWLTVKYMKTRFNDYDTSGLIVKLNYKLDKSTKNKITNFYSSMGTKWTRQNTKERIVNIGY